MREKGVENRLGTRRLHDVSDRGEKASFVTVQDALFSNTKSKHNVAPKIGSGISTDLNNRDDGRSNCPYCNCRSPDCNDRTSVCELGTSVGEL